MPRRVKKPIFRDIQGPDPLAEYKERLDNADKDGVKDEAVVTDALKTAAQWHGVDVVRYLLDQERAPVDVITPDGLGLNPSKEMLEVLINHGWNINKRRMRNMQDATRRPARGILHQVCADDAMVQWCLDHGASARDQEPTDHDNPPLLEHAARFGSLHTMKLLSAHGAKPTRKVLHYVAQQAARSFAETSDKLHYLVDEQRLDVNALDAQEKMMNYLGTPLNYAVRCLDNTPEDEVLKTVEYLLKSGADPKCEDGWGNSALKTAEQYQDKAPKIFKCLQSAQREYERAK